MKIPLIAFAGVLVACGGETTPRIPPSYVDEAPLPVGWPKPGPYNEVTEKSYPPYRAAFTSADLGGGIAFWTLFMHIKHKNIPMTAPVEMTMKEDGTNLNQAGMAFLYQDINVGESGPDGGKVKVKDIPAEKVLSYTWQGPDSKAQIASARTILDAAITERKFKIKAFRLLGYNGPSTPAAKRTWELQAVQK